MKDLIDIIHMKGFIPAALFVIVSAISILVVTLNILVQTWRKDDEC